MPATRPQTLGALRRSSFGAPERQASTVKDEGQSSVVLDLSEGRHVVQVRKPGYVGYLTEVDVRRGETATVNVALRTQP